MADDKSKTVASGERDAMQVTVIMFGNYASLLPAADRGKSVVDVAPGRTVEDLLDALAVPEHGRSFLTLDGERISADALLHDGAVLRVIVPLGGG